MNADGESRVERRLLYLFEARGVDGRCQGGGRIGTEVTDVQRWSASRAGVRSVIYLTIRIPGGMIGEFGPPGIDPMTTGHRA